MEILSNELATVVKGYKRRSWIMHEPFLLNNVSNCYWFLTKIDRQCFACGNLKETLNHMHQCKSNWQVVAKALQDFCKHLSQYHTPAPMANMITTCLKDWFNRKQPAMTLLPTNNNSQCNPAPTHQQSLPQPMHYRMRPFPPRLHCQDMEMSHCTLLLWTMTRHPFQPSSLGPQDSWPSVDYIPNNLAMPKRWTLWQRLQWTMSNSTTNYKTISEANLRIVKGTSIRNRLQHPTCATDRGSKQWTKCYLDAYLATAEVYLEQNVDPG
jgi:hypothetical protein